MTNVNKIVGIVSKKKLKRVPTLVTDFIVDLKVDFEVNHCNETTINDKFIGRASDEAKTSPNFGH